MTSNIVHLEPDPHVAVQQLLPWYVNGRLSPAERDQVDDHMAGCPACRAELDAERLWSAMPSPPPAPAAIDAGWARMRARLTDEAAAGTPDASPARAPATRPVRAGWLGRRVTGRSPRTSAAPQFLPGLQRGWLVPGALSVGLAAALVWTLQRPAPSGDYHALAAQPLVAGAAVVRFRPDATEAQIRAGLEASGARIVDGPTVTGAYVVHVPRDHYQAALAKLRRQSAVALAEALEGAESP